MSERTPFQRITVHEAKDLLSARDVLVLDVRDANAFARAHITAAQNVSIASLWTVVSAAHKATPILIYCYHGYASQEYAQLLSDFRFSRVYSLDGGYEAWHSGTIAPQPAAPALAQWLESEGFPAGDINATAANDTTPLMRACHKGLIEIARALIASGAAVAARNADGNNALWFACVGEHLHVIDALLAADIDINNLNDNGATALMYAASAGKAAVVERLLAAGADTSLESLDGFTALDMASTVECLSLLRRQSRPRVCAAEHATA